MEIKISTETVNALRINYTTKLVSIRYLTRHQFTGHGTERFIALKHQCQLEFWIELSERGKCRRNSICEIPVDVYRADNLCDGQCTLSTLRYSWTLWGWNSQGNDDKRMRTHTCPTCLSCVCLCVYFDRECFQGTTENTHVHASIIVSDSWHWRPVYIVTTLYTPNFPSKSKVFLFRFN